MNQSLVQVTLVVADYDEAIHFYIDKLGFNLVEDTSLSETKRWVRISPPGSSGACLLLAKAATEEQKRYIGNQTGGRVFLFLHTDDFARDFARMKANGIEFVSEPRTEPYGTVVVFKDLYGNLIDFIEPGKAVKS